MYPKRIESDNVLLTEITKKDAPLIVKWRSDERVYLQLLDNRPLTLERHLHWFEQSYLQDPQRMDYLITEKSSGIAAGVGGFKHTAEGMELSYMIGEPSMLGKGLAKSTISTLLDYLKMHTPEQIALATIADDNVASIGLVESLGFVRAKALPNKDRAFSLYRMKL